MSLQESILFYASSSTIKSWLYILIGILVAHQLIISTYNLLFHPLRYVPGPQLAAATYFLEFWYDVVLFGRYTKRIEQMHEQYGPIVRISPNEVHCNDSNFIDEVYAIGTRKRDKPIHQVRGSGIVEQATFSTVNHDLHRTRRTALNKFFSRVQVSHLEPKIRDLAQRVCDKILVIGKETAFDITTAYSLFTTDVISDYCFGESLGLIAQQGLSPNFREPLYAQLKLIYYFRFFPGLKYMGVAMAQITKHLTADMELLIRTLTVDMPNLVKKAEIDNSAGINKGNTIFGSLLQSDLPPEQKSIQRMTEEATSLFAAGTETVSWALTVITFHLLSNPEMLEKLTVELNGAMDTSGQLPSWATLEHLPYLSSVIYEGLRLSYGVASRTSRIATGEDLIYRGEWTPKHSKKSLHAEYVIPRGYAIGMSSVIMHHDERIFPDSHKFLPERWLDENNQHRKQLDRSLLAFSKGSRGCVGMNLAYCELYLLLSFLALRVLPRMKLYETTETDITYDHDIFNPLPLASSKGVRAVIV
ncbi:hypothetical protein MFRU_007g02990 [Monilinia fructicola]|nr:hypothetical protein MFRU_007g02990 [Monilinia fructicola]